MAMNYASVQIKVSAARQPCRSHERRWDCNGNDTRYGKPICLVEGQFSTLGKRVI